MPWRPHPALRDGLAFLAGALIVLGLALSPSWRERGGVVVRRQRNDSAHGAPVRFAADRARSWHGARISLGGLARDHDPGSGHGNDRRARHARTCVEPKAFRAAKPTRL